ncbi:MAG TPA: phosphatidylglycerol lysyltransferase domain-containing protein, partial [Chloroflexota bacterium]|nr:phosphatidylglycerol lysyltransferase domain-containing protein [Chloroflexota bacterium]
ALLLGRGVRVLLTFGASGHPVPFPIADFIGLWTDPPTVIYQGPQGHWFRQSLHVMVALGIVYAVVKLLRPLIPISPTSQEERRRARALVLRHGTDALCYFHLRADRSYIFAPDDRGFVSFVVRGDVALLGGDPVAAPAALHEVVRYVLDALALQGLTPCVVGASARAMQAYRAAGMHAIKIGEEAVIELPSFTRDRLAKRVRRAARHIESLGIEIHAGAMATLDQRLIAQCDAVSRAWLAAHGDQEQGFSMTSGPLPGPHDTDHQLVLAVDPAGAAGPRLLGFISLAPVPAVRGLSLDHMRRLPEAPNGLMEALIIGAAEHFGVAGHSMLSLNFAVLCDKEHPEGEGAALLATRKAIFEHARYLQLRSLYTFNKKFEPTWSCRYWLYQGTGSLASAAYATLRAEVCAPVLLPGPLGAALRSR